MGYGGSRVSAALIRRVPLLGTVCRGARPVWGLQLPQAGELLALDGRGSCERLVWQVVCEAAHMQAGRWLDSAIR